MKASHLGLLGTVFASVFAGVSPAAVVTTNSLYNGDSNYAPDGVASQTTTGYSAPASRANDGVPTAGFGNNSVTHSDDTIPGLVSWQVDLLATKPVDQIQLFNRGEGLNARLSNFRLQVLNSSLTEVWGQNYYTAGGSVGDSEIFPVPAGTAGQFVRVQQLGLNAEGNNVLSLAEVKVIDQKPALYQNVALLGTAAQSSTGYGGVASRANDNNTDGFFGNNSVTHTDDAVPPGTAQWLEIQLPNDYRINEVALWNRLDCCWGRLGNFRLSVFDGAAEVWGQDYLNTSPFVAKGMMSVHDDAAGFFAVGDRVRIELIGGVDGSGFNNIHLAELQIFGVAVPEPAILGLLGLTGAAGLRRRRR